MKLQASEASNLKNLQSQNARSAENRVWLSALAVIHGRLAIRALDREARSAAAGCLGLWIIDTERGADQVIDKVDLRTVEVSQRNRVDQHRCTLVHDDNVIGSLGRIHIELVL